MTSMPAWILLLAVAVDAPQKKGLTVGDPAPPLRVMQWFDQPPGEKQEWVRPAGKVVVLEFWATWCVPCVKAIPHMNSLARRFGDKVQFLALTDEDPAVIASFLKKTPIHAKVAICSPLVFTDFGVKARPMTMVLDAQGRIAAITTPDNVTPSLLEAVVAGRTEAIRTPLARVEIRPYVGVSGKRDYEPIEGGFHSTNTTVQELITSAYQIPSSRIEARFPLPEQTFEVLVSVPGHRGAHRPLLQAAIESSFGWKVVRKEKLVDVFVLKTRPQGAHKLLKAEEQEVTQNSPERFMATRRSLDAFAHDLEGFLAQPVLNETNLKGEFRIDLRWDRASPDAIIKAVRDQLNLELKKETRPLPFLIIEKRDEPK